MKDKRPLVNGKAMIVSGRFPRIAGVRSEYFDMVENPDSFLPAVRDSVKADVVSFIQPMWDPVPRHPYPFEWYELAVLQFESYDSWWTTQINDKTRNMVRKATKKGVQIRVCVCDDEMVRGIKEIYDESPVRQGKPFLHYGKDLARLKDAHLTFLDRSEFIGAYFEGKLIGFAKLIYHGQFAASVMQIIAMYAHRDKAPTNALLAKAVELCAAKGIHMLHYGMWSRRGLGEFKKHNRFEQLRAPRYYVPLNLRGRIALRLGLHRSILDRWPESWRDRLSALRNQWYTRKVAPIAE